MFRKLLAKSIGFPLQDFINKTNVLKTQKILEKSQYWDEKKMHDYRLNKLKKMVHHAYNTTPYYTELFNSLKIKPDDIKSFKDLKNIPILTKKIARENQDKLVSKELDHKYVNTGKTGGTTGVPLVVYKDATDRSFAWGSYYRWYNWMGVDRGDKVISFWGASTVTKKSFKNFEKQFAAWLQNNERLNSFNFSENSIGEVYKKILKHDPVLIKGYLSAMIFVAKYMQENNLHPNKNLKAISTTTETLLPMYRKMLQEVFKVPVYDQYGCGEISAISYECPKHLGLHINEEHVHVEVLDENGLPIYDKTGRLVVTSLNNFAMPFIRYENGDMAKLLTAKCDCGVQSGLMSSIDGRLTDTIKLKNGSEVHGVYFTDIFYELGITTDLISRFQIRQEGSGPVEVLLEKKGTIKKEAFEKIKNELSDHVALKDVKCVERINNEKSGKFVYIKRINS